MKTETLKLKPIQNCPYCGNKTTLAILKASDGREWVDMACKPCGAATSPDGQWTLFVGK